MISSGVFLAVATIAMVPQPGPEEEAAKALRLLREQPKKEVMVLGSHHFAQNEEFAALSPARQSEMDVIVGQLTPYAFTHVGLECKLSANEKMNELYDAWRAGDRELSANERQQIGFRLAAALGHDDVYCVDTPFPELMSLEELPSPFFSNFEGTEAERRDLERMTPALKAFHEASVAIESHASLAEIFNFENGHGADYSDGRMLTGEMIAGIGTNWIGPDFYARFEGRNARIFSLTESILDEGDRMFIIIGNAHKRPLERLFTASFQFNVIEVPTFR